MAAAKHKNPAGAVDLLGIEVPAGERRSVGMPGQQGEKRRRRIQAEKAGFPGIKPEPPAGGYLGDKPKVGPGLIERQRFLRQGKRFRVMAGDKAEEYIDGAAAYHAEILNVVLGEGKIVLAGGPVLQNLGCDLLRAVFHRAAAYGAVEAALRADEHPGSSPPGVAPEEAMTVTSTRSSPAFSLPAMILSISLMR